MRRRGAQNPRERGRENMTAKGHSAISGTGGLRIASGKGRGMLLGAPPAGLCPHYQNNTPPTTIKAPTKKKK